MNTRDVLRIVLWVTPIVLQALIAAIIVRLGLTRVFLCFFVYCIYLPARDIFLWFIQRSPHLYFLYFWTYWVGEGFGILLQLGVVYEVFWYLTGPHEFLRTLAARAFKTIILVAILVACLIFAWVANGSGAPIIEVIVLLERSARVIQVIMLVTVIAFISRLGLTWHHYATGILLGSGIIGLQLVPVELRGDLHLISNETFAWLKPAIYNVAVVAWAVYFFSVRSRRIALDTLPKTDLSRWDHALKEYLRKK
jgi:hypothetical protein